MRAIIYARYSSENQRDASIEDQLRICRIRADREGWHVVSTYADHAISGATTARKGYLDMMASLRAGGVDIVLAESLDRFSRDQEHIAAFYKQATYAGARIVTLAEGDVSELHIGLKGTMGALFLKDLAQKTHRGIEGRIRQGRGSGQLPYGYKPVRVFDQAGEPERGLRQIDPVQALVIRGIFQDYAAGRSPRAIAKALNADGVPGPGSGIWYDATIRGRPGRGDGILRNPLYIGRLVWNRRRKLKDPLTGHSVRRANPTEAFVVQDVPNLRIVDQTLWDKVQDRLAQEATQAQSRSLTASNEVSAFWNQRRPRHLLTGKVVCGVCGRLFASVGGDYLACRAASQGSCTNPVRPQRYRLEAHVLDVLGRQLMPPELVFAFITAFTAEWNRLAVEAAGSTATLRRDLQQVERKIANLIDAITEGVRSADLKVRLGELESRRATLEAELTQPAAALPAMHPDLAQLYRRKVAQLRDALAGPNATEAREAARELIDKVIISPPRDDGDPPGIELVGELAAILHTAGLGAQPSGDSTRMASHQANDVLKAFASSVKEEQGARLPGGGSRGQRPLVLLANAVSQAARPGSACGAGFRTGG